MPTKKVNKWIFLNWYVTRTRADNRSRLKTIDFKSLWEQFNTFLGSADLSAFYWDKASTKQLRRSKHFIKIKMKWKSFSTYLNSF